MLRFISNYIILPWGRVLHNQVLSIDDGRLVEIQPFSGELAYTIYVSNPILIIPVDEASTINNMFESSTDMPEFCNLLDQCHFSQRMESGDLVTALELDFQQHYISKLC